jgi:hypothetical protein
MSEIAPVWCVRDPYSRRWHATVTGQIWDRIETFVKTHCDRRVVPAGSQERVPDCLGCQSILHVLQAPQRGARWRRYAKAVVADEKKQRVLFET